MAIKFFVRNTRQKNSIVSLAHVVFSLSLPFSFTLSSCHCLSLTLSLSLSLSLSISLSVSHSLSLGLSLSLSAVHTFYSTSSFIFSSFIISGLQSYTARMSPSRLETSLICISKDLVLSARTGIQSADRLVHTGEE